MIFLESADGENPRENRDWWKMEVHSGSEAGDADGDGHGWEILSPFWNPSISHDPLIRGPFHFGF